LFATRLKLKDLRLASIEITGKRRAPALFFCLHSLTLFCALQCILALSKPLPASGAPTPTICA